jgi:ABC-type transport system involved in multi-copper enzyme maturation permease subunit
MKKIFYVKYQINCIALLLLKKKNIFRKQHGKKQNTSNFWHIIPSTPYLWAYIIDLYID